MISIPRILPLLVTVLLLLKASNLQGQNLVTNGSFSNIGAVWTFFAPATGTEAYLSETSYGGTVGTNIVAEIDMEANLRQTGIPVVPGTTYCFSFKRTRRTAGAPSTTIINVKLYDGAVTYVNQNFASNNSTWNWQCETFLFTPTGNTVSIDFGNIAATTLGTIIDDVTITPQEQQVTLTGTPCQGGTINLSAPFFPGDPDAVYSNHVWTGPNGFIVPGQTITLNNLQPGMNGNYVCTMIMNGCLTVTATYNLVVTPTTFNISRDVCLGSSYNFYGRSLFTAGVYDTLISSNNNSCDSLIILQLNISPLPDVATKPGGDVAICIGDTLTLELLQPSQGYTHQWIKNDLTLNGETGASCKAYTSGIYKVAVTSDKGCLDTSATINLTVHELPVAQIEWKVDKAICIKDTISFSALPGASYYRWSPEALFRYTTGSENKDADGILKDEQTAVILTAYNDAGCYHSDTLRISAVACCDIFVPNAFSPNNDGVNDYFKPQMTNGQLVVSFQVFDRWGQMVYQNQANQTAGWNGQYANGNIAEGGIFNYFIQYTCEGRANEIRKGSVILIR